MRKNIFMFLLIGVCFALDPVRDLKGYEASRRVPLTNGVWQNITKQVYFEWKEPFSENGVNEYLYYFGKDQAAALENKTTNTFVEFPISADGLYYLKVQAVSGKEISPVRQFLIKYDATPLVTEAFTATVNGLSTAQPKLIFNPPKSNETGAGLKGIDYYVGTKQNAEPERHTKSNTIDLANDLPINQKVYVYAALEDESGNVSPVKLVTEYFNARATENISGAPRMVVYNRTSRVKNILADQTDLVPGSIVTYEISIGNQGQSKAQGVEINDSIPENTQFIPGSAIADRKVQVEFLDMSLNQGKGLWTTAVDNPINVKSIKWIFPEAFDTNGQAAQAKVAYSVLVNQI